MKIYEYIAVLRKIVPKSRILQGQFLCVNLKIKVGSIFNKRSTANS